MTASPPAVTPLRKRPPANSETLSGKHHVVLEADADPERDADDQAVAVVDPVMDGHLHTYGEERRQQHAEIGREHGAGYRQHHGKQLGQERDRNEDRPGRYADAAGAHPGELGHRRTHRRGRIRRGASETGEQVAQPVHSDRALHRSEIHRPRPAPGDALDGDGTADGTDGGDHGHQQESREKRPKGPSEVEVEARPFSRGNADPRCFRDLACVVEAEQGRDTRSGDHTDDRRPEA